MDSPMLSRSSRAMLAHSASLCVHQTRGQFAPGQFGHLLIVDIGSRGVLQSQALANRARWSVRVSP
jgi:hypothetical protein